MTSILFINNYHESFIEKVYYYDRQNQKKKPSNIFRIVLTRGTNHLNSCQVVLENHIHTHENMKNKLEQLKSIENKACLSFAIKLFALLVVLIVIIMKKMFNVHNFEIYFLIHQ